MALASPTRPNRRGISLAPKQEQKFTLEVNTKALVALQTYGGKLIVVTNGGVVEVPLRLDVAARPFVSPGFRKSRRRGKWPSRCVPIPRRP